MNRGVFMVLVNYKSNPKLLKGYLWKAMASKNNHICVYGPNVSYSVSIIGSILIGVAGSLGVLNMVCDYLYDL